MFVYSVYMVPKWPTSKTEVTLDKSFVRVSEGRCQIVKSYLQLFR